MQTSTALTSVKPESHPFTPGSAQVSTAEKAQAAAVAPRRHTVDKQLAHFYLVQIEQKHQHMTRLRAVLARMKAASGKPDYPTEDAIRAGAYALEHVIESYVDLVRDRGCLLHVGCAR